MDKEDWRMRAFSFPEFFQRGDHHKYHDDNRPTSLPFFRPGRMSSVSSSDTTPTSESGGSSTLSAGSSSRNRNVMHLKNILNDVSIDQRTQTDERLRSHSTTAAIDDDHWTCDNHAASLPKISESPDHTKKKQGKLHRCPECHKDFPRPSGLRTHMNTHTKEKPYACSHPGCNRRFSVVSNAKRHMRTHGIGLTADDIEINQVPFAAFEAPIIAPGSPHDNEVTSKRKDPFKIRWSSIIRDRRASLRARPASLSPIPDTANS